MVTTMTWTDQDRGEKRGSTHFEENTLIGYFGTNEVEYIITTRCIVCPIALTKR